MAQKEISMMQVSVGTQRDLPDAMERGQFGFSADVCRLFIGLPSTTDPASRVAGRNWDNQPNSGKENVEIITEFTPWQIVNKLINKPHVYNVDPNSTLTFSVQSSSRAFIEYVAYSEETGSTLLESGSVQMVYNNEQVLLSQQNNTNATSGLPNISFEEPDYSDASMQMTITVRNDSTETYKIEFIIRAWDMQ